MLPLLTCLQGFVDILLFCAVSCCTVIKEFCGQLGVDNKQVQGVIRLAKKNGEKLGFLA
jgi:hypothetical protein